MAKKREIFPPAYDVEGGVPIPHIPKHREMDRCAFAQRAGTKCPLERKIRQQVIGALTQETTCGTCPYNWNIALKKAFVRAH